VKTTESEVGSGPRPLPQSMTIYAGRCMSDLGVLLFLLAGRNLYFREMKEKLKKINRDHRDAVA